MYVGEVGIQIDWMESMNEKLIELHDKAILMEGNGDYFAGELDVEKYGKLVVIATIQEMCQQLWNYGIDESNNPSMYKAIESVKKTFGVK